MRNVVNPIAVEVNWQGRRIIPSRFPPISLFERVTDPVNYELAFYIESLTNDRLRDEVGDLSLVLPQERISGPGTSPIMASFTHIGYSSRFTTGNYGVYYAASNSATAIAETTYHRALFLSATNEPDTSIHMREYVGDILLPMLDITHQNYIELHNPDDYSLSQSFGLKQRLNGHAGILYSSVRKEGGFCVAVFKACALSPVIQSAHYEYMYSASQRAIRHVLEVSEVKR